MEPRQQPGGRVSSDFLERKMDLIAKTNQLINGHRNAQATNSGRSISLGSAKEINPSTADVAPSSSIRNCDEMDGPSTGQKFC